MSEGRGVTMRIECRWGGLSGAECWNVAACGCRPSTVEEVWREAHAEQFSRLCREVFDEFAAALHLPQFVAWVARRMSTREDT